MRYCLWDIKVYKIEKLYQELIEDVGEYIERRRVKWQDLT